MTNLDLKGRKPEDLPDKETCNDILLDLKDTGLFNIRWIDPRGGGFRANGKPSENWTERGQVVMYEVDNSTLPKTFSESFTESTVKIKEKRYDISRYPIRLNIEYKTDGDFRSDQRDKRFKEIHQLSSDVYQRLKDYIGSDVIQDQFLYTNFQIDFLISECKIVKQ